MMPVKNNYVVGVLVGLILPLLAYFMAEILFKNQITPDKPGVPYLIAVGINLIILRFTFKANKDKAGTGLLVVTFIVLIFAFIFEIKLR
jgi:predicted Na+-dependent transporter